MKKIIFILVALFAIAMQGHAQSKSLYVYKNGQLLYTVPTTGVDSVSLTGSTSVDRRINFYKNGELVKDYYVGDVDRIRFKPLVLSAPTNVVATLNTSTSPNSINVSWNAVSGAESYNVYRSSVGRKINGTYGDMSKWSLASGKEECWSISNYGDENLILFSGTPDDEPMGVPIVVETGKRYTVSFDYSCDAYQVYRENPRVLIVANYSNNMWNQTNSSWIGELMLPNVQTIGQHMEFSFTAPQDNLYLVINFGYVDDYQSTRFEFNNWDISAESNYQQVATGVTFASWADTAPLTGANSYKVEATGGGLTSEQSDMSNVVWNDMTNFVVNGVSFNMVKVPSGTFLMGSTSGDRDEQPVHSVTLSEYSIGETEVTQELWQAVMGSNPSGFKGSKLPVEQVTWDDCQTFIQKLNQLTGQNFRLPTEAQWEYAAKGGLLSRGYTYSGSNIVDDVAWHNDNSNNTTHEVGTKTPNELGIYDMSGNVWEWCQDWYGNNYSSSPQTNPTGPSSGTNHVLRGGAWNNIATGCRSAIRSSSTPSFISRGLGLRLALYSPSSLSAPTNVVATLSTSTSPYRISVTWNAVTDAQSYTVYRSSSSTGTFTKIADGVTATSWTDTAPLSGTNYYKVVATGYGLTSEQSTASNVINYSLSVPTNVKATLNTSTSPYRINVSWSAVGNAQSYTVYRSSSSTGSFTKIAEGITSTSWTDTAPLSGPNYYTVVAAGGGLTSALSTVSNVVVCSLSAPTNVRATLNSSTSPKSVNVSWNAVSGAQSYNVYRSSGGGKINGTYGDMTKWSLAVGKEGCWDISNNGDKNVIWFSGTTYFEPMSVPISVEAGKRYTVSFDYSCSDYQVYQENPRVFIHTGFLNNMGDGVNSSEIGELMLPNVETNNQHMEFSFTAPQDNLYLVINFGYVDDHQSTRFEFNNWNISTESNYQQIATGVTSTSWTDTAPLTGANSYKVVAAGYGLTSEQSAASNVVVTSLSAPTNVRATLNSSTSPNRINVFWNAVSGAQSYNVYRSSSDGGKINGIYGDMTKWTLTSGKEDCWSISNNGDRNVVDFSGTAHFEPMGVPISVETGKRYTVSFDYSCDAYLVYQENPRVLIVSGFTNNMGNGANSSWIGELMLPNVETNNQHMEFSFTAPQDNLYLVINFGYVDDYQSTRFEFNNWDIRTGSNYQQVATGVTSTSWTDTAPLSGDNYYKVEATGYGMTSELSDASNVVRTGSSLNFVVNGVSFNMIKVSGGTFQMGSTSGKDDEKPVHSVTLSDYSIGETEVTQELWQAVMGSNPSNFKGNKLPVEKVSWNDCQTFIQKLNQLTGQNFRLPTEAEWEFAAKGGTKSNGYTYSGSNTIGDVAWYWDNSSLKTHEVATKAPNELGIYDMSGNVNEWCQDWYDYSYYSNSPRNNPTGPSSGSDRVGRGGSWGNNATRCRTAYRDLSGPTYSYYSMGLRLAL